MKEKLKFILILTSIFLLFSTIVTPVFAEETINEDENTNEQIKLPEISTTEIIYESETEKVYSLTMDDQLLEYHESYSLNEFGQKISNTQVSQFHKSNF